MTTARNVISDGAQTEAITQLDEASATEKCWSCGCLHNSLDAIESAIPLAERAAGLDSALRAARRRLVDVRYECLGCPVCYPPLALNALGVEWEACPTDTVEERSGWPPLPGAYTALRYRAPVAICTLTDASLANSIAVVAGSEVAMVGTCQTENLGIERIIQNTLPNPNIRFLIVCGADSQQTVGHLPGQSLVALSRSGVDARLRIVGAAGRRPVLRNLSPDTIEQFRRSVAIIDMIGHTRESALLDTVTECAARDPGPAEPIGAHIRVATVRGNVPERMTPDPAGYFVVYVDNTRSLLSLEHYRNDGVLVTIIEGTSAAELYTAAIERGLLSRLDHAAYLGRELARAEQSLATGEAYVQDGAPERAPAVPPQSCGCGTSCGGHSS